MSIRERAEEVFTAEGLTPSPWSAEPGHRFGEHHHDQAKILICVDGEITFHLANDDVRLAPGDRLDLPAGTNHSATVGPGGVTCWEAFR